MRAGTAGWRSARGRGGAAAPAAPAAPVAPAFGRRSSADRRAFVAPPPSAAHAPLEERHVWPWSGVDWTPGYVSFLAYVFVISSYAINIGQPTMVLAILAITMSAKDRWRFPAPFYFLAAFLLVVTLTFQSTEYRSYVTQPLEDLLKVCMIFVVAATVLTSRARLRFFMFFYLAVFALYPARGGLLNWFVYNATTQGRVGWNHLFENPNDFAALMIFPLALAIAVWLTERQKLVRIAAFLGVAALPLVIFLTQSRGAILALGGGAFTFIVLQGKGRLKALVTILAVLGVVLIFAPSGVWERMSSLSSATESGNLREANDSGSAEQRFEIWKVAWRVHEAFPITGVGWAAYPNAHADFSRRPGIKPTAQGARDSHNTYLTVLAETGWVGFLLWCSMIGAIVVNAIAAMKRIRPHAAQYSMQIKFVLVGLLSYGFAGAFGSFAHVSFLYLHLATLIGMAAVAHKEVDDLERGSTWVRGSR